MSDTQATATHLIYDGEGGWIEAVAIDGGWRFSTVEALIRWLHAPDTEER